MGHRSKKYLFPPLSAALYLFLPCSLRCIPRSLVGLNVEFGELMTAGTQAARRGAGCAPCSAGHRNMFSEARWKIHNFTVIV